MPVESVEKSDLIKSFTELVSGVGEYVRGGKTAEELDGFIEEQKDFIKANSYGSGDDDFLRMQLLFTKLGVGQEELKGLRERFKENMYRKTAD